MVGVNANNFSVEYDGCSNIGATQEYVDDAIANIDIPEGGSSESSFDIIITSQEELEQFFNLEDNMTQKKILVKGADLLLPNISFKNAKYVEFSKVRVADSRADVTI